MTNERVNEIIKAAKAKAKYGPWSDQLDKVMSKEERREVMKGMGVNAGIHQLY